MRGADTWSVSVGEQWPIAGRRLGPNELWTSPSPSLRVVRRRLFHGRRGGSAGVGRSGGTNGDVTGFVPPHLCPRYTRRTKVSVEVVQATSAIGPVPALELHVARARRDIHRS